LITVYAFDDSFESEFYTGKHLNELRTLLLCDKMSVEQLSIKEHVPK